MHGSLKRAGFSRAPRILTRVPARVLAVAGILTAGLVATTTAANAATTTVDYTCHKQNYSVYTCQWLRQSLRYVPNLGRNNYQFVTWVSMKGGTVNREIIQLDLEYREVIGGAIFHSPSGLDVKGGSGTISANLSPRLCNALEYRPRFQFKYFEPKPTNKWVTGWSYGDWYNTSHLSPLCNANPGIK